MPIFKLILAVQVVFLVFINLFCLENYLAYDSSAVYLQLQEIVRQGTFLISDWVYTSTLTWDTPLLFAVPFYQVTGKLFFSYGLAILISIALFLWSCYALLDQLKATRNAKIIFTVCALTPFVSFADSFNRIDYYAVMLSIFGVYLMKTAITLLLWTVFLRIDRPEMNNHPNFSRNTKILDLFAMFCAFFTAVSSGYHVLLFGIVPPLIFAIGRNVALDSWKKHNILSLAFFARAIVASVLGKCVSTLIIGRATHESNLGWTEIDIFWENLQSIFQGYLALTGALPPFSSPAAFSPLGLVFGFYLALSMGLLVTGVGGMIASIKSKKDSYELYYSTIFFVILLLFTFIYTTYGANFFEVRYLIPAFILQLMFASIWLSSQLSGSNRSLKYFLILTVLPCLVVVNAVSYYFIHKSQDDVALKYEIIDYLADHPTPVVYLAGLDTMIHAQNIRVFDEEKIHIWTKTGYSFTYSGDYTYYLENSEYQGPTVLLATERDFTELPNFLQSQFTQIHQFSGWLNLYETQQNPFDFVSGVTQFDYSIDYPYSYGANIAQHGALLDNGSYQVEGTGGLALWSSHILAREGVYDVTLNYEVLTPCDAVGTLSLTIHDGGTTFATATIPSDTTSFTLKSVDFNQVLDDFYQYRVQIDPEVEVIIHSITFKRVT